jgi:hypothetical protein
LDERSSSLETARSQAILVKLAKVLEPLAARHSLERIGEQGMAIPPTAD